jgi:electron transfer flavoprotein alpha subunit
VSRSGTIDVTAVEPGGKLSRSHRVQTSQPIVCTVRAGVAEVRHVPDPPEAAIDDIRVDLQDHARLTRVEKFLTADPATIDLRDAVRIVAGGRGTGGSKGMHLVAALAKALRASPAASRLAVDLGWAPRDRQVGQTGKIVQPDLYVACGISGASHHLAGMRDSRHIVAINSDPTAPIHEIAHLSLIGDLHRVVPAIQTNLRRRDSSNQAIA